MASTPIAVLAAGASPAGQPPFLVQMIPFILLFVVFYFLLILPARKKQKKHAAMLDALKSGDKVVTSGGILGTVHAVHEQIVQLRVAPETKIEVLKSSIAGLQGQPE